MKVLIIEDEPINAQLLQDMLAHYGQPIEVVATLRTVKEAADYLLQHEDYDLIISDIRLGGGTVFQAFQQAPPKSFVIFTTAYSEYAIQAIKHHGIDYLEKPFRERDLFQAIDRLKHLPQSREAQQQRNVSLIQEVQPPRQRFLFSRGEQLIPVQAEEISFFDYHERTIAVHTSAGELYALRQSMASLEASLDARIFFRISRQYIININQIAQMSQAPHGTLHLWMKRYPSLCFEVKKERIAAFYAWLEGN